MDMKVLILYHSKTGHTLEAATATADGIRSAGSEVDLVTAKKFNADMIANYDGLIVGSPCWAGSITGSGVAKPIAKAMKSLPANSLEIKRCGSISVFAAKGGSNTIRALGELLSEKGCKDYKRGPTAKAGVPFSAWTGPAVTEEDEEDYKRYGSGFVAS